MKLNDFEFEIEVISKTEFIDDFTVRNKKYLITSWFVHVSCKALSDYHCSELPSPYWESDYITHEEYETAYNNIKLEREKWEQNFKRLLGQQNEDLLIKNLFAEFFTAVKIERIQK